MIFSYQAFSIDIYWHDDFNFRNVSPVLLGEEVPIVQDMLTEITKNKRINICIGQVTIYNLLYPDPSNNLVEIDGEFYPAPQKRTYYTSSTYDISEKVSKIYKIKKEYAEMISDHNMVMNSIHLLDFQVCFDKFTLHEDTQTFNENDVKQLYDYFLDEHSVLYQEMLSQFNQCKDAKAEYLEKHNTFMESISIRFSIGEISPKLSFINGKENMLKHLSECFTQNEDIKTAKSSMLIAFDQYKREVGSFIKDFYHSETRFMFEFFRSPLYQVLRTYCGDINIRLHTYFNCCSRCRNFISNGFYVKLKKDMKSSSSLKIVVSFNEPYYDNIVFLPIHMNIIPNDGVFFTQVYE